MLTVLRLGLGVVGPCAAGRSEPRSSLLRRLLREEDGQDLIEYALLSSAIGLAGAVAFSFISDAMRDTYTTWDDAVQDDVLVEMPEPAARR